MLKIIITDLDGTLLHPKTYSFDAALPALQLIKEKGIPLILCSSKTRAEIEVYREKLRNNHPFISENGGGIFIPEGYFKFEIEGEIKNNYRMITLGKPYNEIRRIFLEVRKRLGVGARGFGDMDAKEIAVLTGMQIKDAVLANKRDFDEPFIFEEEYPRIQDFLHAIENAGFHWTQGSYFHILGDNDKGKAVKILQQFYKKKFGEVKTIGLGNNLNDLPFLREVDVSVLVKNEDSSYDERVSLPNLIKADGIGPEGWNKEMLKLI
jgi:mannosyl-3-phosphoglycerate phosphatase